MQEAAAAPTPAQAQMSAANDAWQAGRRRSSSEPRPLPQAMFADDDLRRQSTIAHGHLQPLYEGRVQGADSSPGNGSPAPRDRNSVRRSVVRSSSAFHIRRSQKTQNQNQNMMGENVIDVLDVIGKYPRSSSLLHANAAHRP